MTPNPTQPTVPGQPLTDTSRTATTSQGGDSDTVGRELTAAQGEAELVSEWVALKSWYIDSNGMPQWEPIKPDCTGCGERGTWGFEGLCPECRKS